MKINQGSILPTLVLELLLCMQIPKEQKDSQVISVFLHLWDLRVQKLLLKRWWNWPLRFPLPFFAVKFLEVGIVGQPATSNIKIHQTAQLPKTSHSNFCQFFSRVVSKINQL